MKIILKNDQATIELGKLIAREIESLKKSSIEIHLEGDLGTGKTFLTKSIIKSSGWNEHVKSPTYTLCEEYDLGDLIFLHIEVLTKLFLILFFVQQCSAVFHYETLVFDH